MAHHRRMEISVPQTQKPKNSHCFVLLLKSAFMLFKLFEIMFYVFIANIS